MRRNESSISHYNPVGYIPLAIFTFPDIKHKDKNEYMLHRIKVGDVAAAIWLTVNKYRSSSA